MSVYLKLIQIVNYPTTEAAFEACSKRERLTNGKHGKCQKLCVTLWNMKRSQIKSLKRIKSLMNEDNTQLEEKEEGGAKGRERRRRDGDYTNRPTNSEVTYSDLLFKW